MVKVKVGDRVKVVTGGRRATEDGVVVKVGRVWVTIGSPDGTGIERRFRLDNQTDGSKYGWGIRFYTLEQWAGVVQRDEARKFLREQGISVEHGSPWQERLVELATRLTAGNLADAIRAIADKAEEEA